MKEIRLSPLHQPRQRTAKTGAEHVRLTSREIGNGSRRLHSAKGSLSDRKKIRRACEAKRISSPVVEPIPNLLFCIAKMITENLDLGLKTPALIKPSFIEMDRQKPLAV